MYTLYLVTCSVSGKRYVGITRRLFRLRKADHLRAARTGPKTAFHYAIRKYGPDSFRFEVLSTGLSKDDAILGEQQAIRYLETKIPSGYNCTDGGDGTVNLPVEVRAKMSAAASTRPPISESTRAKLSAAGKLRPPTASCRELSRAARTGQIASEETRAKMSAAARSRPTVSAETRAKMSQSAKAGRSRRKL